MMCRRFVFLVFLGLILNTAAVFADDSDKEKTAVASAEKWVSLIDQGKYGESWMESSEYFKQAIRQEQWEQAVNAVREPLGKLVSRKVKSAAYTTSLPGAPDGEYIVIEFIYEKNVAVKKYGQSFQTNRCIKTWSVPWFPAIA